MAAPVFPSSAGLTIFRTKAWIRAAFRCFSEDPVSAAPVMTEACSSPSGDSNWPAGRQAAVLRGCGERRSSMGSNGDVLLWRGFLSWLIVNC